MVQRPVLIVALAIAFNMVRAAIITGLRTPPFP